MCIDYFKRGSLEKTLARDVNHSYPIDDSLIVNMAMNAANGLHFLHSKHIIHRYEILKPALKHCIQIRLDPDRLFLSKAVLELILDI